MIVELPRPPECYATEFDCGNMGILTITDQQAEDLGMSPREIADRYVSMVEQNCPVELAKSWAEGTWR